MKTLVINVLGGPGTGKSIFCSFLFGFLKMSQVSSEHVQEEIRRRIVGLGDINDQLDIVNKQADIIDAHLGKVKVVIADGNLIHSAVYNEHYPHNSDKEEVREAVNFRMESTAETSLNIFLNRGGDNPYEKGNRLHSFEEAQEIDSIILDFLKEKELDYINLSAGNVHDEAFYFSRFLVSQLKLTSDPKKVIEESKKAFF